MIDRYYSNSVNIFVIAGLILLLFASLCTNFWLVGYAYNTKSTSSKLYTSNLDVGNDSNLLLLHNITNRVSLTSEVNISNLLNLQPSSSKPGIIIDSRDHYLTRNYTAYISAKEKAELVKPNITIANKVIGITHTDLLSNNYSNNNNKNSSSIIISLSFDGLSQLCCIPPDVQLAAGSRNIMETVNSEAAIYTKTGELIKKFGLESLFNLPSRELSDSHSITDPVLLFDDKNASKRWFAAISDITTYTIRLAISKTDDPTGVWMIYNFPFESMPNNCSDQPFVGASDDKVVISVNTWSNNCDWLDNGNTSPRFRGIQLVVADKHDLLTAARHVKAVQSVPNTNYFSLRPALTLSPTTALFLITTDDFNRDTMRVLSIDGSIDDLHVNRPITGHIQTTHISPDGIQPITFSTNNNNDKIISTKQQDAGQEIAPLVKVKQKLPEYFIHTGDARTQTPFWYKGRLWFALNVGCLVNTDIRQTRSCIRVIEFDTDRSRVILDFDIGSIGASLYYPALSIDKSGNNIGILFGYSSSDNYPSLLITGGSAKNITSSLKYSQFLKKGTSNSLSTRYGDYFSAAIDPSDQRSIWVAGQYHLSSTWSTYIGKLDKTLNATK